MAKSIFNYDLYVIKFMNGFILTKCKLAASITRKCLPYKMSAMYLDINENIDITIRAFIFDLNALMFK